MAINIYNGSSWEESTNPKIYDGSNWVDVQKGEIYNGSSWEVFFTLFPGPAVAPTLTDSARTLKTVTAGVSLSTAPPAGYSVRIRVQNVTTGSGYTYLPSAAGTTGTISTTYTSSSLSPSTSYTISAVSEYLKSGSVVAVSAASSVTITTRTPVAPTLSIYDKTTSSITIRVQHTGGVNRRLVIYRGGDPTVIDIPGFGAYTTSNIDTYLTFSGLSSNTRYFFYGYTVYEEGPTTSDTSSTFTTTKYVGSRVYVPSVSGYASANETFYFSQAAYGSSSNYSSSTTASKASDNDTNTSWISEPNEEVPEYETKFGTITALFKSNFTVAITAPSHGYQTSYGAINTAVSYIYGDMSTASYPKGDTYVSAFFAGSFAVPYSNGNLVTISGSNNTAYNKSWYVRNNDGTRRLYLEPVDGTYPAADSSAFGGQIRTYSAFGGQISLLGGSYLGASNVQTNSFEVTDSDFAGDVALTLASGSLSYEAPTGETTTQKKAEGNGEIETVTIAIQPSLPSGATSVRIDALRFYSAYTSPKVQVWINGSNGPYWNTSVADDSGPYSVTGIPLGATITPNQSYGGVSNCWKIEFEVDRNAASVSSLREAEFQYSYVPLIDPGD
jgi:hypothetical protein